VTAELVVVLIWGTVVGLDLVSVAQTMVARPLVAGTVAGLILGDPTAGATVGVILELFALDVMPFGAVKYPDYGVGTVAAAATAAHAPGVIGTGIAVCVGLGVAYLGEQSIRLVRNWNTSDVRRCRAKLDEGDVETIARVHLRGLGRDTLRSFALTAMGLLMAFGVYRWFPVTLPETVLVTVVVTGAALGAAAGGIVHAVGRGPGLRWFAAGLGAGLLWVVLA
jgi:mannose/fructose/N-acetylgalactosamine-specific phosphotransferase system component IIC